MNKPNVLSKGVVLITTCRLQDWRKSGSKPVSQSKVLQYRLLGRKPIPLSVLTRAANAVFGRNLKMFLSLHKSDILILMETRIGGTKADDFIHICYQKPGEMTKVYRTAVYASPNGTKQKKLWPQLAELVHDPGKAWLLGEDCNAIVSSDERGRGSINRSRDFWVLHILGVEVALNKARISGVETALEKAPSNALIDLERDLKMELNTVLTREESLWYKKSWEIEYDLLPNETVLVCSMINNKGEWDMDVLKTMLPSSSIAYITAVKQPMANDDFEDKPSWK
ncbi:hypothetical protein GOBAR_DD26699 [Gossypium barbadense]|nr:hypothetical protein GOBAR_DD26699 [Gossypium barbadense]